MLSHTPAPKHLPTGSHPRARALSRAGHLRSPARAEGRRRAAIILDRVLAGHSAREVARRLGVAEAVVRDMRDGTAGVQLGDLLALPPGLADEIIDAMRAAVHRLPPPGLAPERHLLRLYELCGSLSSRVREALDDDRIDDAERDAVRAAAAKIRERIDAFIRDLDA